MKVKSMSEQAKSGNVIVRVEHVANRRGEIVAVRVSVYVTHCFEEAEVPDKAFYGVNVEKCMLVPFGSVTLFAGEVKSTENVRKKFNKIVDMITEARKFDQTLNDVLTAVKDVASGIRAKYEEFITPGEVV
jgi:hypothetical protein